MARESKTIEARCSECDQWSEVSWYEVDCFSGYWWLTSGPCPKCGKAVRVEELERREVGDNRSCKYGKET